MNKSKQILTLLIDGIPRKKWQIAELMGVKTKNMNGIFASMVNDMLIDKVAGGNYGISNRGRKYLNGEDVTWRALGGRKRGFGPEYRNGTKKMIWGKS